MPSEGRWRKFLDRVNKPVASPTPRKQTTGDIVTEQLGTAVKERLDTCMPLLGFRGRCDIKISSHSFWEHQRKQIVVVALLDFSEDVEWKD